jgi:hypothetical protein
MMYRLGDTYALPMWAPSPQVAWSKITRQALKAFFRCELKNAESGYDAAIKIIKRWSQALSLYWDQPRLHDRFRAESVLAISSLRHVYDKKTDTILDVSLPYSYVMEVRGVQYEITDTIDVLYFRHDKVWGKRIARAMTFSKTWNPVFELEKLNGIRSGLIYEYLRKQVEIPRHVPIEIVELPVFSEGTERLVTTSNLAIKWLEQVLPTMEVETAFPTGDTRKCRHCPFDSVCSIDCATADEKAIEGYRLKLREKGSRMPFYDEHPWRVNANSTGNV